MKYELTLDKRHPNKEMFLGKHLVKCETKVFDLSDEDEKQIVLRKNWIKAKCVEVVKPKKEVKKVK